MENKKQIEPSQKRTKSVFKAIGSGFIWGFGQLLNKQYIKALFFFVFFLAFIGIELGTSNYFTEVNAYDKIPGQDYSYRNGQTTQFLDSFIRNDYIPERSKYNEANMPESFRRFDEQFLVDDETKTYAITEQQLIDFIAQDLALESPSQYHNIFSNQYVSKETMDQEENVSIHLVLKEVLYRDPNQVFYRERNYEDLDGNTIKDYIAVDFITGVVNEENVINTVGGFSRYEKNGNSYIIDNDLYVGVKVDFTDFPLYMNLSNPDAEPIFDLPDSAVKVEHSGPLYLIEGGEYPGIYEYISPGLIYSGVRRQYEGTTFTKFFVRVMYNNYNQIGNTYSADDYTRFVIKVNLALNPSEREAFETGFNNFFYDKAGFFVRSYWGVFTLGTTKKIDFRSHTALNDALTLHNGSRFVTVLESVPVLGHVSTHVLLEGLIGLILSLFFLIFLVWSVVDAYRTSEARYKEEEVAQGVEYFKDVYESSFEYIVLSPALFVLAFISIMPIVFGFLLAFTSISGKQSMIDTFDYVGFQNFFALFNFADGFGASFGRAFWRVLGWTIIWAVFSTATVFFGGLFQALILNSERVQFKKFWRTILILPWAMPALLSQMVFSVMFGETGFINNLFRSVGLYDLFIKLGWLGQDFSVLRGVERLFYIGKDNIQWFTNPFNPTFVKIVLIIVNIWLGFPYFMALMSGIMTSIDKSLYEAADIDGATKWQKLKFITMPLILYSTAPILIMTFSGNFNNFGVIYFITGGGPNAGSYSRGFAGDTDILISWMYKLTVDESIYNIASVFSVLIFIFVGSITAWNLSRTRAFKED